MAQQLIELVEQFCTYQRKHRGRTEGGVKTYRWNMAGQAWAPHGEADRPDRPAATRGGNACRGGVRDHGCPDHGFTEVRRRGSHVVMQRRTSEGTITLAVHGYEGEDAPEVAGQVALGQARDEISGRYRPSERDTEGPETAHRPGMIRRAPV